LAAEDRAKALEKDAKASRQEKDAARTKANELAAQLAQESRLLRQTQLAEQTARRTERKQSAAPTTGSSTAPTTGSSAAPTTGSSAAPTTGTSTPAAAPSGPEPHGSPVGASGGGAGGKPQLVRVGSKTGKSTTVNAEYAPKFQGVIDYLDSVGYNIYSLGGFVDRDVRGQPGKKSVHAHGGAIDINPAENPLGSQLVTDMPPEIGQIAAQFGLGWGGNWSSIKDAMHFSVAKNEGGTVKLRNGGVLTGPQSGYRPNIEMHGSEAVIPLKNGAVPVMMPALDELVSSNRAVDAQVQVLRNEMGSMMRELVNAIQTMKETGSQERMIQLLESMSRSQQSTATATQRMAQLASN
jgi:hypothetical protein